MNVGTATWQLVAAGADPKLIVQNVGDSRIAWVIAASLPGVSAIALDGDGEHGLFLPGMMPATISGMDADTKNLYVRSLGSKNGDLYVYDPAA